MEPHAGIEPASSAWQADVIAVIRMRHFLVLLDNIKTDQESQEENSESAIGLHPNMKLRIMSKVCFFSRSIQNPV